MLHLSLNKDNIWQKENSGSMWTQFSAYDIINGIVIKFGTYDVNYRRDEILETWH